MTMRAIRTFAFWTFKAGPLARIICRVTKGSWAHMGIGFRMEDMSERYFEALYSKGVVGPKPISELKAFGNKKGCRWWYDYAELDSGASQAKYLECRGQVGKVGYYAWQLACMWAFERLGVPVPHSPDRVVCSELVARVLSPELDLRDAIHNKFDMVNPASAYRRWIKLHAMDASSESAPTEGD